MHPPLSELKRLAASQASSSGAAGRLLDTAMRDAGPATILPMPATLPSLAIVCCSIKPQVEARFRAEVARAFKHWPALQLCVLNDAKSLAEAYNRGGENTQGEWIVFCHDDIRFLREDFAARLAEAMQMFDVLGPAGCTRLVGPSALWGGPATGLAQVTYPLPDQRYAATICGIGPMRVEAQALDGVFIAVRRSVWEAIRFDAARFDQFHLYDIDFSYACHRQGHRVGVVQDLHLLHDSQGNFDERWSDHADRFVRKYNLVVETPHPSPSHGLIVPDTSRIAAMFDAINAA